MFGASSCFPARPAGTSIQNISPQTDRKRNQSTITGCLIKNPHNEYELVDEKGIHNLLNSSTILFEA